MLDSCLAICRDSRSCYADASETLFDGSGGLDRVVLADTSVDPNPALSVCG